MSKYANLRDHLKALRSERWVAPFDQIEKILGFHLPQSARKYPAWWANQSTPGHSQVSGWMDAGWRTTDLDLRARQVTFMRFAKTEVSDTPYAPTRTELNWEDVLSNASQADQVQIEMTWSQLGTTALDSKQLLVFPRTPTGPALYKIESVAEGKAVVYFGETEEITRRFQHYRTPGPSQRTNQRLNELINDLLSAGENVSVCILSQWKMIIDGHDATTDLADKFFRRALENLAIVAAINSGQKVLNK